MKELICTNILENIDIGTIYCNQNGDIIYINNFAGKIFRFDTEHKPKTLYNLPIVDQGFPLKENIIRQFKEIRRNKKNLKASNIPYTRKDHSIGYLIVEIILLNENDEEYFLFTFQDITKIKNLELGKRNEFDGVIKNLTSRIFQESAERTKLQYKVTDLYNRLKGKIKFSEIIGKNPKMQNIFNLIKTVSETNANVLINGETGTGKELVARAIHNNSLRKDKPFIKVDCASLTDNLLESELFGHEKGAFTGAYKQKKADSNLLIKVQYF